MARPIVLIHSPLLGPVSWRWVADELRALGHGVTVPSIIAGATAGSWRTCVQLAAEVPAADAVLVGHSGAGPLLPSISAAMPTRPTRLVFVDAGLPPERGDTAVMPDAFAEHLRALARDGVLPPWSEWFGPDTIATLIPDAQRRREVLADMPEIPLAYFDERVPLPQGWADTPGAYILLSETYRADAEGAASRGWPVIERLGGHMDLVARPPDVAHAIHEFALA